MFASPLRFAAVTTQRSPRHHSASPKKTKVMPPSPTASRLPRAPPAPRPRPLKLHPTLKALTPCRDCPSIQDQCEAALGYADELTRPVIERVLPHLPEAVHGVEVCLLSDDEDETAPCPTLAEFRLDFLPAAEPFSLDRPWPLSLDAIRGQRSWTRSRTPEASAVVTIARLASSFAKSPSPMTSFSPPCAVVPFLFTVIYGSCAMCFVGVGAARGPWGNPSLCEWQAATGLGL